MKLEISTWRTEAYEDVAAGRLDIALSAEEVPPALESEVILDLDFVCLVGSAQRMRSRRLTLRQYLQFPHALVETLAGQQTLVDRPLAQLGAKRHVVFSLPFFVPRSFAHRSNRFGPHFAAQIGKDAAGMAGLRVVEPPREIKAFPYFMAWHPRLTPNRRTYGFANNCG